MKEDDARRKSTVHKLTESVLSVARRSFNSDNGDSAKESRDNMLGITQKEAFVENHTKGVTRYHAKLIANSNASFTLYSTRCEYCDKVLRRFSCGGVLSPFNECRQRLCDIQHSLVKIKGIDGVEARRLQIVIPGVFDSNKEKGVYRVPWCPRVKKEFQQLVVRKENDRANSRNSDRGDSDTDQGSGSTVKTKSKDNNDDGGNKDIRRSQSEGGSLEEKVFGDSSKEMVVPNIAMESRLPEWNSDAGSLVLTFQEGRVREPSAKNFLLTLAGEKNKYLIQFGKVKNGKYNLDFKYPLCPLQAFGVALSAFSWKLESPN